VFDPLGGAPNDGPTAFLLAAAEVREHRAHVTAKLLGVSLACAAYFSQNRIGFHDL
jgi:hypothetical protein